MREFSRWTDPKTLLICMALGEDATLALMKLEQLEKMQNERIPAWQLNPRGLLK